MFHGVNISECARITGYPNIAWTTDFFSNWIAQNSNIMDFSIEKSQYQYDMLYSKSSDKYQMSLVKDILTANLPRNS